jgi:hypothetical protein
MRVDPGGKEDFIGIDISNSGNTVLVKQEQFCPPAGSGCIRKEPLPGYGQGIRAESPASDECRPVWSPSEPAEPTGIGKCQACVVIKEDLRP